MEPASKSSRTIYVPLGELVEGTITNVLLDAEPFHCTLKITPTNPDLIPAEGRYSSHEVSLNKLKRNLTHLKFKIKDLEDVLAAIESLQGRKCIFKVDDSGWVAWIQKLIIESVPITPPAPSKPVEIFWEQHRKGDPEAIYHMTDTNGYVGFAVGMTESHTSTPHGWQFYIDTFEEAVQIRNRRKSQI